MYCKKCGGKLNEHDTICSNCGNIVEKENVHQTSNSTVSLGNLYNVETNTVSQNNNNNNQLQINEVNQEYNTQQSQVDEVKQGYNNEHQESVVNNYQIHNQKRKNYWLIPLKLFLAGIACFIVSFIIKLGIYEGENNTISTLFSSLYFILLFLVLPSIVYAAIKSNSKPKTEQEKEFNTNINSASNLEEKMIIAYVGNNYEKVTTKKFNFAAWFFNIIYIWYRKMYIQGILLFIGLFLISIIFNSVIKSTLTFIIIILVGFKFNKIYMNYVKKQVQLIKNSNPNSSESELINICKSKGGTNVFIAIVILIVLSTISSTIYQHFNKIQGEIGDENNGYVLEYSLPSEVEESGYNSNQSKTYYLNSLCDVEFKYRETDFYESSSDYINSIYCHDNNSCDIKSIKINSNTWYYVNLEDNHFKDYNYVHKDNDKLYIVEFSISKRLESECSSLKPTVIKSLKFVER